LPGDTYRIESFLEVWTEISLDGGTTFYPADASLRLELTQIVPEPTTLLLLVLGLSMMNARRRAAMP
jgi:hypothetical protein